MIPVYSKFIDCFVFHRSSKDIQFLLLLRSEGRLYPNTWQNIQGKIEPGEKAYDAARRELKEETGISPIGFWNLDNQNSYYFPKTNEMYLFPVFVAESNTLEVELSHEHKDYDWLSLDDAVKRVLWRCQKNSLTQIYDEFHANPNYQKLEFTKL